MAGEPQEPDVPTGGSAEPSQTPKKPKHQFPKSEVGKLWDEFGNPEEPINLMPGGTYNSAGGKPKETTFSDVMLKSLSTMTSFYKTPCARDALLVGIGTGFGVGGIKTVLGGTRALLPASNWAVGSFAVVSLATHQFCQRRRAQEREGMKEAVEMMADLKQKKAKEKQELAKKAAEEAARAAEEQERKRRSWTNLSNYKFW